MKKRSLGGAKPETHFAMSLASNPLNSMEASNEFIARDAREISFMQPDTIRKTFNARFIPCSFDQFKDVDWPDLEIMADEARELYPTLLKDKPWFVELDESRQRSFFTFLSKIHSTAQTILQLSQIHPITLEREHEDSPVCFVVDGERRTLAVFYSKGRIPVVKASIFNRFLNDVERALIKDIANTAEDLTTYERILSKKAIIDASDIALDSVSARELGHLISYNKDQSLLIRDVLTHEKSEQMLKRIKEEDLSWRNVRLLLKVGPDGALSAQDHMMSYSITGKKNNKSGKPMLDADVLSLQERYSKQVGYACTIKQNKKSNKIKLEFNCTLDSLNDMIENMARIRVIKDEE